MISAIAAVQTNKHQVACSLSSYGDREQPMTVNNLKLVERYIAARKAERGLTPKGEQWIRSTLPKFALAMEQKGTNILMVTRDDVREFLSAVNGIWHKHSHFRAIRAFYNWLEREGKIKISPCYKMQAPKTPKLVLPRPTLSEIAKLLELAPSPRDKALISLMADTGFRRCEIAGIQLGDIRWDTRLIKVMGKGAKERIGKFSDTTEHYLREHLASYTPNGNIWGINYYGIGMVFRRLQKKTGITCNPHSFRRAWAIESIRQGVNLLDVQVLGGWEDFDMVKRYAREVNSEDAISRYKPLMQRT
jgi:site-specific recombinase XerD